MLLVDQIAKRRGKFAHEVLRLSMEELAYEIACVREWDRERSRVTAAIQRSSGGMFPVPNIEVG